MADQARRPVVFVIDDDDSVRRSLGRLIRSEGYAAQVFASAEEFLAAVAETPNACLVLDIAMPGMSGLDLQARLRERRIGMPVIIVTARDDERTRREAKRLGAKFYFRKPVDDRSLIDAIDWAVNSEPHANFH